MTLKRTQFLRLSGLFVSVFSCLIISFQAVATSLDAEMKVLNLFYKADELVVSATHYPKPIHQVAENITVVTAEEIRAMNAHSVSEVLSRVTGVFLAGYDRGFGTTGLLAVQGSDSYHTLVLLDGVKWNFYSGGNAATTDIPVGIIQRIEIIKGPASSAWGSSLGGVVNIITKTFSGDASAMREVSASYGERGTSDLRGQWARDMGSVDAYVFAQHMVSDGLRAGRSYERTSVYAKAQAELGKTSIMGISAGYSRPELCFGSYPLYDFSSLGDFETGFATMHVDHGFFDGLNLKLSSYIYKSNSDRTEKVMTGNWWYLNTPGDVLQSYDEKNNRWRTSGKLTWEQGPNTALVGMEYEKGHLKSTGYFAPGYGIDGYDVSPSLYEWATYINDTVAWKGWSLTAGIRYDKNNRFGGFASPSLGLTWRVNEALLLRATAARGFSAPPVTFTAGGGLFLVPNPDLEPETVNSYQVGAETVLSKSLWLKADLFRHDVDGVFFKQLDALGPYLDMWINAGEATRRGGEVTLKWQATGHVSVSGGLAYVHQDPETRYGATDQTSGNFILAYENQKMVNIRLMGHFLYWDEDPDWGGSYNDSIWDANIEKTVAMARNSEVTLFVTGRNLFNGSLYDERSTKNPRRWMEAGMRMTF